MLVWLLNGRNKDIKNYAVFSVFRLQIIFTIRLVFVECPKINCKRVKWLSVRHAGVEGAVLGIEC